uniref:Uncharacterized protein n=1 Tax=Mesocestoides corti TaxID=53468 RepID=A0A5K3G0P0_MESCO
MLTWRRPRWSLEGGDGCDWLPGIAESTRHFEANYCNRNDLLWRPAPTSHATLLV